MDSLILRCNPASIYRGLWGLVLRGKIVQDKMPEIKKFQDMTPHIVYNYMYIIYMYNI